MTNYITNPEWVVLRSTAIFSEIRYDCCQERYPDISFHLWLMRHSAFYTYILIVPSVLLSSLTSVIFWLPPESPSKIVLAMNVFVAFLLLHLLLEDTTPAAASSFPLLGAYFCFNMGVITVSMFLSCITVNLHFRADHTQEIPRWLLLAKKSYELPDVAQATNVQVPPESTGKQSMYHPEVTQSNDCVLCLRAQNNSFLIKSRESLLPLPTTDGSEAFSTVFQSLGQKWERELQSKLSLQGLGEYCAKCDMEARSPSPPCLHSPPNRFHMRLLGSNRITQNSPVKPPPIYRAQSMRDSLMTNLPTHTRESRNMIKLKNDLCRVERDVHYITSTIKQIELDKLEEERKHRISEQWRTICLALDRVFFVLYLITLIVSMCLFHPTVMSSLENNNNNNL
ncbi:unnamed protein product [Echinostoma caproni]|uniref:Neur_chan_memb domain-containing protein n=1 Tax=Echinostoma caproni TaxID=27848 RepID=A0A183A6S1_9TREM|nr:unnamed protein product [Echinostoma caproni]